MSQGDLRFGGRIVAIFGIMGGVGIALGLPAIVLTLGQNLGVAIHMIVIVLAVLGGVLVAGISAFFGAVMPSNVGESITAPFRLKKVVKNASGAAVEFFGDAEQETAPADTKPTREDASPG